MKYLILITFLFSLFAFTLKDKVTPPKTNRKDYAIKNLVYIPTKTFLNGKADVNSRFSNMARSEMVTVDSFYMAKTEVTNLQYLEFLAYQKKVLDSVEYNKLLPDTLVWRNNLKYHEPYTDYYLRHPAYHSYPVVGVNHFQATAFCIWLTKILNNNTDRSFKKVKVVLPTEEQWCSAVTKNNELQNFPWGNNLCNTKGCKMANYREIKQEDIGKVWLNTENNLGKIVKTEYTIVDEQNRHESLNTAPAQAYKLKGYELTNMCGNVREMIREYGKTKGGGFDDTGYYLQNHVYQTYDSTSETSYQMGFRYAMEVIEY